uniref:Uncharacterized protein n=1 Tax=viral metagenome TaxID=1070528 RepID=A0A6M3LYZ3_9ZZZZ
MSGETRCRVCGRLLTAPLSVERGIGPVCWARLHRNHTLEDYPEEDSVLATKNLLQRYQGTLTCRGCGQPILEGDPIVKRRVNSRARYYHQGCIYTEKKTEEAEG